MYSAAGDNYGEEDAYSAAGSSYRIQGNPPPVKGTYEETIDYGQPSDDSDEEIVPVITKKVAKKRVYAPEILLLEPKSRTYSNTSVANSQPCGGAEKSFVHFIATPGSRNFI